MKTKIVIALISVVAFSVLATGIVLAHNSNPAATYPTGPYERNTGYGWGRGCYGYDQQYNRYPPTTQDPDTAEQPQPPVPPQPTTPTDPNHYYQPQSPNQPYYPRSYGRGCWGW